jgi:hypothetical protein
MARNPDSYRDAKSQRFQSLNPNLSQHFFHAFNRKHRLANKTV